jgi:N,N-dimethylformamidase
MADPLEEKKLIGYCNPWSVAAGEQLDVMVSCLVPGDYQASFVELICGDSRPHGTGFDERGVATDFAGQYPGREQLLRPGSFGVLPDIPSSDRLSFCCYLKPTLLARDWQPVACGGGLSIDIVDTRLRVRTGTEEPLVLQEKLRLNRWHLLLASYDSVTERLSLACRVLGQGAGELDSAWFEVAVSQPGESLSAGDWHLAAGYRGIEFATGFNGRIEAPRLTASVLSVAEADDLLEALLPGELPGLADDLIGAWDFSQDIATSRLKDVSGHARHGKLFQTPTRAVKGVRWDGSVQDWRQQPSHYGAVHFHEDDLTDAGWDVDFSWQIPPELPSGVYALKLELDGNLEYVPFFVRPGADVPRAKMAYLASTATYIAYANQRLGFSGELFAGRQPRNPEEAFLMKHPEVGYSLYEYHADGSGVHFSSRLRPILNMKPRTLTWSFNADTNITNWLKHRGDGFDVITDEDLHRQGVEALADYDVVITGAHPEYFSTRMLDGVRDYLEDGGRLMYLGGNGFYWRIAHDPENPAIIEVRRAEGGTRAWMAEPGEYYHAFSGEYGGMWRRLGRPPNELVGVGFAAQGFDGGTYYRLTPQALDDRVAFIRAGVKSEEVIGNYGTQGGGAAGEEIDRFDVSLGSPEHALVLASSEKHRAGMLRVVEEIHMSQPDLQDSKVRADMTFFETPVGGAVFSTGSISYAGALAVDDFDNDIARITDNVLNRFLDPAPFEYPG